MTGSPTASTHRPNPPVGRPISGLLDRTEVETWAELFTGFRSNDQQFEGLGVHLVAAAERVDRFKLRGVRFVDSARSVIVSIQMGRAEAESESSEDFASEDFTSDGRAVFGFGDLP